MGYRLFTAAVLLLTLLATPASGSTTVSFDEQWWNGLDETNQLTAVQAAMDAYASGYLDGVTAMSRNEDAGIVKLPSSQFIAALNRHTAAFKTTLAARPNFPDTFGTYMHGVSDFYANHPDAASASIGPIIACLASHSVSTCDALAKIAAKTASSNE